jgi:deoxyribonuclease V
VWPASPDQLIALQHELAAAAPPGWHPHGAQPSIAAWVVCFARGHTGPGARGDRAWAAAAVLHARRVIAQANIEGQAGPGYTPGLLALREGPCLEAAVRSLRVRPDVLLVDATGRDHPRHAGLALQLGAVLDVPTVGVTHRPLPADGAWPPDIHGATAPLLLNGVRVGAWLRTRAGARPLAVHAAWRTDVDLATRIVLTATLEHRTPEPFHYARNARAHRTWHSITRRPASVSGINESAELHPKGKLGKSQVQRASSFRASTSET